jgi:hypothetical protein
MKKRVVSPVAVVSGVNVVVVWGGEFSSDHR